MCRLRDLAIFVVATTWASVGYAQISFEQEAEKTPDEIAANEFVQELRAGAEAPRQDQNSEPTEQSAAIDELLSRVEEGSSDPDSSLEGRVQEQRVLVNELRQRYPELHPETMRAVRTLEQMESQLEREKAARSERRNCSHFGRSAGIVKGTFRPFPARSPKLANWDRSNPIDVKNGEE